MMEQMQVTFDDLDGQDTFGFDDLSLESYRQDLLEEFNKDKAKYLKMPKGIYTGFNANNTPQRSPQLYIKLNIILCLILLWAFKINLISSLLNTLGNTLERLGR